MDTMARSEKRAIILRHWRWFVAGAVFAAFLIATQARSLGGLAGLLLVGDDAHLRGFIEALLDNVPLVRGEGHDGQIYFAMAHDLDGSTVGDLVNNPGIRYRRPVLPVLSSFGGLFSGSAVLWTTAAWLSVGTGVAWMSVRAILKELGASPLWMAPLIAYPGFWLAVRLFTPDMIGFGAALLALAIVLLLPDRFGWAVVLMVLATLTKEAFLAIPVAAGAWLFLSGRRMRGALIALVPAVTLAGAVALVLRRFDVEAVDGNLGLPFMGIIDARDTWPLTPVSDRIYVYLTMALLLVGLAAIFVARSGLLRWLIAPWLLIATVSSEWIWEIGNGLSRSFAPVAVFAGLAAAERVRGRPITDLAAKA